MLAPEKLSASREDYLRGERAAGVRSEFHSGQIIDMAEKMLKEYCARTTSVGQKLPDPGADSDQKSLSSLAARSIAT